MNNIIEINFKKKKNFKEKFEHLILKLIPTKLLKKRFEEEKFFRNNKFLNKIYFELYRRGEIQEYHNNIMKIKRAS